MDYEKAKKLLNIECDDYKEIREKYRKQVLLHHPDRNGNKEDFHKIQEAYEFLLENVNKPNEKHSICDFLRKHLSQMTIHDIKNIYTMLCNGEKYELLLKFQEFILKNMDTIEINEQIQALFEQIKQRKEKKIIILQPSINDLLQYNVYKMTINNTIVNIPLWHEELLYEINNMEYLIKMIPDLDNNVHIIDNNLVFNLSYNICDIWNKPVYFHNSLYFDSESLVMKPNQQIILYNQGLPQINTKNVFDISKKGNIILNISLYV
tara:strand:- start:170 stop:961 length:792 start_codon:yes stop_codon:yes gene_type:complete